MMDRIDPIRADIAELRNAMEQGFARLEGKMEAGFARLETKMEAGFTASEGKMEAAVATSAKEQTRFLFLAWAVLLAAIVGLYGR